MPAKISTLLCVLFLTIAATAQTTIIQYSSQNISDRSTLFGLPEPIIEYTLAKKYFTLKISNNESLYYKTPGQDPILDLPIKEKGQYITYADENYYYKNLTEDLMLFELAEDYGTVKGKDKLPVYEWDTRSEETKKIKGYKCKRATLWKDNTLYIAWYTDDLPAGFGPDRFGGLPGTILMLKFRKTEFIARSIKTSKENTSIERPVFSPPTSTFAEWKARAQKKEEANEAKYPVKDYGAVKLVLKTEADIEAETKTEPVKE